MLIVEITYQLNRKYVGILESDDEDGGIIVLGEVQEYIAERANREYDLIEIDVTRCLKITRSTREE